MSSHHTSSSNVIITPSLLIVAVVISLYNQTLYYVALETVALLVMLALVIYYFYGHYNKHTLIPHSYCVGFYLAFCIWAGLSVFWSAAQTTSALAIKPFLGGILAILLGYAYSTGQARRQIKLLTLLAAVLSLFTIYQALGLKINRPAGLLRDWNTHAAFLTMLLLPLCSQFLMRQQRQDYNYIIGAGCALLSLAITLTLSRGAFLSLGIGLLLISFYALKHTIKAGSLLKLLGWIIAGFLLAELFTPHESFTSRLQATTNVGSLKALGTGRHLEWQPAWEMFLERPLLGWGFGTYHLLFPQFRAPLTQEAGFYAHNDYLQFLAELGPVGLLLFLGFVSTLLVYLVKLLPQSTGQPFSERRFYTFTLLSACLGMLAHTALNFNLYQLPMQILLGFYVGRTLHYLYADQTAFVPATTLTTKQYYGILGGFSLPIMIFLCAVLMSLVYGEQSRNATNEQDKVNSAWKAQLVFPFLETFDYQKSRQLNQLLKTTTLTVTDRQQAIEMSAELIDSAIAKHALNPLNYVAKAELLQVADQQNINDKKIKRNYEQALKINPYSLEIRAGYAGYLLQQQQAEQALAILWDGWNRFTVDYYQNAILFLQRQLQINQQFGKATDNQIIEQEINKLITLNNIKPAGTFILKK